MTEYRVGQTVRVTYTASVAEVGGPLTHREGRVIRLETSAIPTGWVDPSQEGLEITVIREALPTAAGMYWQNDVTGLQQHRHEDHTDGRAFHYLNASGHWVDLGWGRPDEDEPIYLLVEPPF